MAGAKLTTGFFGVQRRGQDRKPSETYADLHIGSGTRPKVSVIVPLYNEQESIRPLYAAIVQAMGELGCTFEMVFVDDGSRDDTVAIATQIARIDSRLRIVVRETEAEEA